MEEHYFSLPRNLVVGNGVIERAGHYFASLWPRRSRVLVVTGPNVARNVFPRVEESLREAGFDVHYIVVDKPTVETAEETVAEIDRGRYDVVVGLGGGKSIDIAKYSSYKAGKDFVSIPTAASHDGITSPFASLKGFDKPVSMKASVPQLILLDALLISQSPRRLARAGFGDILGKWTAVLDWRLAHKLKGEYYGEYAASLALMSAKHVITNVDEIGSWTPEGIRILLEALVSSGVAMCIAGSSRPASGSEHLFSHALDLIAKHPALHGEQVALGTIMMLYLHGRNWVKVKKVMSRIGLPTKARELGVSDVEVIEALTIAHKVRPERYTILGEKGLTWEAAERLARKTGVID
ncbi:MAG: NAD(P)-dependent glycerol-1-phosphate dehydrogenase [Desulfurococcales archaeon]|nr:NAD(P)-dependent glycerol-1-phosphate dehydrogenase [Desulfurococcales archaeon]